MTELYCSIWILNEVRQKKIKISQITKNLLKKKRKPPCS